MKRKPIEVTVVEIPAPKYTGQEKPIDCSQVPRFLGGTMDNAEWQRRQKAYFEKYPERRPSDHHDH